MIAEKESKNELITFAVSPAEKEEITAEAERNGMSRSAYIRHMILYKRKED